MKKIFLLLFVVLFASNIYAQQNAFQVIHVKAEENSQDNIEELFDNFFGAKKMKEGNAVALERIWMGGPKDMTHRVVFLWPLGGQGFEEGEITPAENRAFWSELINRVEAWGPSHAGRFINFIEGDIEVNPYVQIWDIIPEDPESFKKAQLELVNSLPDVFKGRFVGFGTYDINRPDGATHWALVSGKNVDDHLSFVTELQTKHSKKFMKYIEDRGGVELISNFTFENLRFIR